MAFLSCCNELNDTQLTDAIKSELLDIVKLAPPDDAIFLSAIEFAIQKAFTFKAGEVVTRSKIKKDLARFAKISTKLREGLEQLPYAAYQLFDDDHGLPELIHQTEESEMLIHRASNNAIKTLSGGGSDTDEVPYMLAADIARAFEQSGLIFNKYQDKAASRSGEYQDEAKTMSGGVMEICCNLIDIPCGDIRVYLRAGHAMNQGRDNLEGIITLK